MEGSTPLSGEQELQAQRMLPHETPHQIRRTLSTDYRWSSPRKRCYIYVKAYSAYTDSELATFPFAAMKPNKTSDCPPNPRKELIHHLARTEESRNFHPFARLPPELQLRILEMDVAEIPIYCKPLNQAIPRLPASAFVSREFASGVLPAFYRRVNMELVYVSTLCDPERNLQMRADESKRFLDQVSNKAFRLIRNLDITLVKDERQRPICFELRFNRVARSRGRILRIYRAQLAWRTPIQPGSPRALALAEARQMINAIADRPFDQGGLRITDIAPLVAQLWKVNASSPVVGDAARGLGDPPKIQKTLGKSPSGRKIYKTTTGYERMFGAQYLVGSLPTRRKPRPTDNRSQK